MIVGLLSDTHNHHTNLGKALDILRGEGVEEVLHLGDVTDPGTLTAFDGLRVHHVIGNGDFASGEIAHTLKAMDSSSTSGFLYTAVVDGVKLAATHGHLEPDFERLVSSGDYAYVFHGHSHRRKDELVGGVRVINPGALGGLRPETRSCALLELPAGTLRWFELD